VHADAIDTEETVGHGAAGIAGGGHEHMDLIVPGEEILQQTRHETRAYVLESQGRSMEEFQRVDARLDLADGAVEGQGLGNDPMQNVCRDVLAEERIGNHRGDLREGTHRLEKRFRKLLDALRHIESTVFREAFDDGLPEIRPRRLAVRAVVSHCARSFAPLFVTFTTYTSHLMPWEVK
jgi:hypothetical protein